MKSLIAALLCLVSLVAVAAEPAKSHPDASGAGWAPLFKADLSNGSFPAGVWTVDADGVITASKDEALWSERKYNDFILDLEFRNDKDTNSGVIVHTSDKGNWIPNSVEVQIADDHGKWGKENPTFRCGAVFGHQKAAAMAVKQPGEWNRYTISCIGPKITVVLNGQVVNEFDMTKYTDAKKNPDGSDVPPWLSKAKATLPLEGHIGFQGKHAGAPIYFRNIRIKEL
jgi:Domain of Unknown Function (DUF1080)